MGVWSIGFGGFSPRRKTDALLGAAIRLGPFGTGRKRPPARPPSHKLPLVFGDPFGILPILRAADVSTLVCTTGRLFPHWLRLSGFFFLSNNEKNCLGKRSGVCGQVAGDLSSISRESASVPGSGWQPMTRPKAGPSTPLWGGRLGCHPWAQFAKFAAATAFCVSAQAQQPHGFEPQLTLDRVELRAGGETITAQVAKTPQEQQTGLMHRAAMPRHEGMLFVFQGDRKRCVWMRDTVLPLTAAFLDAQGRVVNLVDLTPQSEQIHCSAAPARFVLEMGLGWFADAGIEPGGHVRGVVFDSGSGVPPASCWPLLSCGLPPQTP